MEWDNLMYTLNDLSDLRLCVYSGPNTVCVTVEPRFSVKQTDKTVPTDNLYSDLYS